MAKYHANNATEAKACYKKHHRATTGVRNTSGVKNLQILTNDSKLDSS